jgi:hypothetical protein
VGRSALEPPKARASRRPSAVHEFALDRFPDFVLLRVSLAVELIKAGQVKDAKRAFRAVVAQGPQLGALILDYPGLNEI